MLANEFQHAVKQRLPAQVAELAQGGVASQVHVAIRIASRTAQRTLPRNLDGQHGQSAAKDFAPGRKQFSRPEFRPVTPDHRSLDVGRAGLGSPAYQHRIDPAEQ